MGVIISANLRSGLDARLDALKRTQKEDDVERITALWAEQGRRHTARDYARALIVVHGVGRRFGEFFKKYDIAAVADGGRSRPCPWAPPT